MSKEAIDITLENLLNLSLGTPEIGAVNFNFLHEVITEILKHLGISNKLARVTHEVSYRDIDHSIYNPDKLQSLSVKDESIFTENKLPEETPNEESEIKSELGSVENLPEHDKNERKSERCIMKQDKPKSPITDSNVQPSYQTANNAKSASQLGKPLQHLSRRQSVVNPRRSSIMTTGRLAQHAPSQISNEATILSRRSLERRDSKTPAGDMWHILNINRRVEASEAAMQGMTSLIDDIHSEIEELRNTASTGIQAVQNDINYSVKDDVNNLGQDAIKFLNEKIKLVERKFLGIEDKLGDFVVIEQLNDFCTSVKVKKIVEKNLENFKLNFDFPIETAAAPLDMNLHYIPPEKPALASPLIAKSSHNAAVDIIPSPSEAASSLMGKSSHKAVVDITSSTSEAASPLMGKSSHEAAVDITPNTSAAASSMMGKSSYKTAVDITPNTSEAASPLLRKSSHKAVVEKRDSNTSKTRISFADITNKMASLDQEITKAKERIEKNELELSCMLNKAEEDSVNESIIAIQKEMSRVNNQLNVQDVDYQSNARKVHASNSKTEELELKQNKLAKSMQKLERNFEDFTDSFHQKQSERMKDQAKNTGIDEAIITKVRGTIFEVQEQQSKFQNQIDSILQDSINKDSKFDDFQEQITDLQEKKIDKIEIEKLVDKKADRTLVENTIDRNQFDACIADVEHNLQTVLQKLDGTEHTTKQNITELQECLLSKMDLEEAGQIRGYIDSRLKGFKPEVIEKKESLDTAAGSRKKLIQNCNCISCDRRVNVPTIDRGVALPYYQPLPGMKTIRPINTFDLQSIRHMQNNWVCCKKERLELSKDRTKLQKELLQLCGVKSLDELALQTNRACGGVHTLVEQHKRNPGKPPMLNPEEHAAFQQREQQLFETDVLGRDGHIYKGRLQTILSSAPRKKAKLTAEMVSAPNKTASMIIPRPSVQKSSSAFNPTVAE